MWKLNLLILWPYLRICTSFEPEVPFKCCQRQWWLPQITCFETVSSVDLLNGDTVTHTSEPIDMNSYYAPLPIHSFTVAEESLTIYRIFFSTKSITQNQGLSQDFHNRVSKLGFQELRPGCPKSLIEKVKIITLTKYINKLSNYMLNSSRNECLCYYF